MPRRFRSRPSRTYRSSSKSNRLPSRQPPWLLVTGLIVACLFGVIYLLDAKMRPIVVTASTTLAHRAGAEALNVALTDEIERSADAAHLFSTKVEDDNNGITVTRVDIAALTQLQSTATEAARDRLSTLSQQTIRLPLVNMFSGSLLSRSTLTIPVHINLLGTVHSSIESDVQSMGVNQVVHIIYLHVTAEVMVITPFVSRPTVIDTRAPVAYVVMAGPVPNAYYGPNVQASQTKAKRNR